MKIGIIGGSGVVGSAWLKSKKNYPHSLFSFQRKESKSDNSSQSYTSLDINNAQDVYRKLKGLDLIILSAAHVSYHKKDAKKMFATNVVGTQNVVNACIENKVPHLILISSTASLDSSSSPLNITEDNLWDTTSDKTEYAKTKYYSELEAWRGQEEGLKVAVVCPGIVIGDGLSSKSSNQLYDVIRKKWNVYPTGSNGFINAKELAKIINLIIEKEAYGRRYLAVTHNIPFKTLFEELAKDLNLPPPQYPLKGIRFKLALGTSKLLELLGLKSPLPSSGLKNTKQTLIYSPANIYTFLNYKKGPLL